MNSVSTNLRIRRRRRALLELQCMVFRLVSCVELVDRFECRYLKELISCSHLQTNCISEDRPSTTETTVEDCLPKP